MGSSVLGVLKRSRGIFQTISQYQKLAFQITERYVQYLEVSFQITERYLQYQRGTFSRWPNSKFILFNLSIYLFYLVQIGGGCEAALRPFLSHSTPREETDSIYCRRYWFVFSVKICQRGSLSYKSVARFPTLTISPIFSIRLNFAPYFPQPIHPPLTFNQYSIL